MSKVPVIYEYGDPASVRILIQPVDDHDLAGIENEAKTISELAGGEFRLIAVKIEDWNRDLSPWEAPPVFGKEAFGGGAAETLAEFLKLCDDKSKRYYIGGYSLAGSSHSGRSAKQTPSKARPRPLPRCGFRASRII